MTVGGNGFGNFDFVQGGQGLVHRGEVLVNDGLALAGIGFADGLFDLGNGLFAREHVGNGEEAGLHDRIDAPAHAGGLGHGVGVDDITFEFFGDDFPLDFDGKMIPDIVGAEGRVEQERRALLGVIHHVVTLQKRPLMAGDKVRPFDQEGGMDGIAAQSADGKW